MTNMQKVHEEDFRYKAVMAVQFYVEVNLNRKLQF